MNPEAICFALIGTIIITATVTNLYHWWKTTLKAKIAKANEVHEARLRALLIELAALHPPAPPDPFPGGTSKFLLLSADQVSQILGLYCLSQHKVQLPIGTPVSINLRLFNTDGPLQFRIETRFPHLNPNA